MLERRHSRTMPLAVDHDAAFGIGQVLAHQVPVDGVAGHAVERESRARSLTLAFRMSPSILPSSWTLPSGLPPLPSVR